MQPHPFAAGQEDLAGVLASAALKATASAITLTLPTRGGGPIASPVLVRDRLDAAAGEVTSGQWQVSVLESDADLALAVLSEPGTEGAFRAQPLRTGSRRAWTAAAASARCPTPPDVILEAPRAVWRPVLTAADAAWARTLAVSAPPALFATDPDGGLGPWGEALDCLVDGAARAALGRSRLTLGRAGDPVSRVWLSALTGTERVFGADSAGVTMLSEALTQWLIGARRNSPVMSLLREG